MYVNVVVLHESNPVASVVGSGDPHSIVASGGQTMDGGVLSKIVIVCIQMLELIPFPQ
jgi:hypothetical protein